MMDHDDSLSTIVVFATSPLEFKFAEDESGAGELAGYGASFNSEPDSHGDVIAAGAFSDSLAQHKAAGTMPAMLVHHDQTRPIGAWKEAAQNQHGLFLRGKLNLATADGREVHEHLKAGSMRGLSIGYAVPPGGRVRQRGGTGLLHRAHVHEVSVVAVPSNGRSRVTSVKSFGSAIDLEKLLRETGVARGAAKKIAAVGYAALSGEDPEEEADPLLELLAKKIDANSLEIKNLLTKGKA